jgi:hypothetical protein
MPLSRRRRGASRAPERSVCVVLASAIAFATSGHAQGFDVTRMYPRDNARPSRSHILAYDTRDQAGERVDRHTTGAAPAHAHAHSADSASDAGSEPHHHDAIPLQADGSVVYDDNVTRAWSDADKRHDTSFGVRASTVRFIPMTPNSRVKLEGVVGVEQFVTYEKLSLLFGSVRGEIQYRPSGAFFSPTLGLSGRVIGEQYNSSMRRGWRSKVSASVRQSLTDKMQLFGALAVESRDAKSSVFDGHARSAKLNLDYALDGKQNLYVGGEFRRGDIVSDGQATLTNIDLAKVFAPDDAFTSEGLFAYRLEARTWIAVVGYNLSLSEDQALDVSWLRSVAKSVDTPSFQGASRTRYEVNQYSLTYLLRF